MRVNFDQALSLLEQGQLVAVPTETVYGLAARIDRPLAIEAIFTTKGRPRQNPLILHVASFEQLEPLVWEEPGARDLIDRFWPGPLTLVLPCRSGCDERITAGLATLAVRSPAHQQCRALIEAAGPLVAPSANPSGRPSPTCAEHVEEDYGGSVAVLDGGPCRAGVESTILTFQQGRWQIARCGALAAEELAPTLGYRPTLLPVGSKAICPGQQWRHYAPAARLIPFTRELSFSAVVGFSDRRYGSEKVYNLGSEQDPYGCLQQLYSCLRQLDRERIALAAIDLDFPRHGLWVTLHERLEKAIGSSGRF